MKHNFIHACAGAGKTELIVRTCANPADCKKRLVITLTDSGQEELVSRLSIACTSTQMPDVMGWYSFLINHYIRPYLPNVFPHVHLTGFIFDREHHPKNHFKLGGTKRYFSDSGSVYKETLAELSVKVAEAAGGSVEHRLSRIYDEIIIDEVQDISRKSLDIIERILKTENLHLVAVGDVRQSLLDSDLMSTKNRKADRLGLMRWYRSQEKADRLNIKELCVTKRSNQEIAAFSDRIFPEELGFAKTCSDNHTVTGHDGVFLIHENDLDVYLEKYRPVPLRDSARSGKHLQKLEFRNIGKVKGLSFERVIIFPTKPMLELIADGKALKDKSACTFYVGVTRARASVAIIISDQTATQRLLENPYIHIKKWIPQTDAAQ